MTAPVNRIPAHRVQNELDKMTLWTKLVQQSSTLRA